MLGFDYTFFSEMEILFAEDVEEVFHHCLVSFGTVL